eukprot:14837839-Heterocapsa_arctica.AAC.1
MDSPTSAMASVSLPMRCSKKSQWPTALCVRFTMSASVWVRMASRMASSSSSRTTTSRSAQ